MTEEFVRCFYFTLSKNKKKAVKRLVKKGIQKSVAVGLLSAGRCSYPEALMISKIIDKFRGIEIFSYTEKPQSVCFSAMIDDEKIVYIYPQYRLIKPLYLNTKGRKQQDYWHIDLAIELHIVNSTNDDSAIIAIWGMEYDGHPQHFNESSIRNSHLRDLTINTEYDINIMHITEEIWKDKPQLVHANLSRFIERRYQDVKKISFDDLKNRQINLTKLPTLDLIRMSDGSVKATHWLTNAK
ncbi:hypothetical protein [Photorhabdus stackebrandtii]|uniref:Uncharacterized protein n=1 Tax=Photorhabdus stackebrandtii TaxID=1123042 RepID=A0A7X5QMQ0_9GAMM|nr:hypothetical protein [Photorhabdus stackebrandtii]NHB97213.1 hypothetical protein [Photorhabdus stackebrandtii]